MRQRLMVVYNQKGGVGKTTIAVNLAALSAQKGKRTLLIDSDPQGNSTCYLRGDGHEPTRSLVDFYESCLSLHLFRQSISDYITTLPGITNLHLVACNRDLEDLRNKLENKHKIHKLREGLKNSTYEHIFFDPPPANDFFALSCLIAAHEVLVPIDCDSFSVRAAKDIFQMVEEVKADHNPQLVVRGMIINQYQKSSKHSPLIVAELAKFGCEVFQPYIPASVKVRESHSEASPVVFSFPNHPVSQAISQVHDSIFPNILNNYKYSLETTERTADHSI